MEKLKDAKNVRWTESYTDRTEFLKNQFESVIGKGIYRRWEGKEVGGPGHWYVVVSPADVHEHKRAKFFAGVRKLPDSYPAGGKYFDTIKEAYQYAHDTWGVPIPAHVPTYTAGDLRGISKKIAEWEKTHKEADFELDLLFKTSMSRATAIKDPWHFNVEYFRDIIEKNIKILTDEAMGDHKNGLAKALVEANESTHFSASGNGYVTLGNVIIEFFDKKVYHWDTNSSDVGEFKLSSLKHLFTEFKSAIGHGAQSNEMKIFVDKVYATFFRDFSVMNYPRFSDMFYADLLKKAGYLKGDSAQDMTAAEAEIEKDLESGRKESQGAEDQSKYIDQENIVFSDLNKKFREDDEPSCVRFAAQICYLGRKTRAKNIVDHLTPGQGFAKLTSVPGYSSISKRSHFEDGILSSYNMYRENVDDLKRNYDFSRFIYSANKQISSAMTYEQFLDQCNADPGFAEQNGLVRGIGGRWSLRRDYLPVKVWVSFGRNDSSVRTHARSHYNSNRPWDTRINFNKYTLDTYKDDRGYSALELAFLSVWGIDFNVGRVPANQQQKQQIDEETKQHEQFASELLDPQKNPAISKSIKEVKEYLLSNKDVKTNKHYRMNQIEFVFEKIREILESNGLGKVQTSEGEENFIDDKYDAQGNLQYFGILSQLKRAFSGWIIFKCSGDEKEAAAKLNDWKQEVEGKRYGAYWSGLRAVHNNLSKTDIVALIEHSAAIGLDTTVVDSSALVKSMSYIHDFETLDASSQEKLSNIVSQIKSMKKVSVRDFRNMVNSSGLSSVIGERQIYTLFSEAAASGFTVRHMEGITKPRKKVFKGGGDETQVRSVIATEFGDMIRNNLSSIKRKTVQNQPLTEQEISYNQAARRYLSGGSGLDRLEELLSQYTGDRIPLVKLKYIINSQSEVDDSGNKVFLCNPPHLKAQGKQEDAIISKAAKHDKDFVSQFSTSLEPSDYVMGTMVNAAGIACPTVSFRDYYYYKSIKNQFENTWKLKQYDPTLYEQVLRAYFVPDDLVEAVKQISGEDAKQNIDQIETLISSYFDDKSPYVANFGGAQVPMGTVGDNRKARYSSRQMFNKGVGLVSPSQDPKDNPKARYQNLFVRYATRLKPSSYLTLQSMVLKAFAYDLITQKTVVGEDGKPVKTGKYIASLGDGVDEKEYDDFLRNLILVTESSGQISEEEQAEIDTKIKEEAKKYRKQKDAITRNVKDAEQRTLQLESLKQQYISVTNKIKKVKTQEEKDAAKKLPGYQKLIKRFCIKHFIPADFSNSKMRDRTTPDSALYTSSEKSQTANQGYIVTLGKDGTDISNDDGIHANIVNYAIVANHAFTDFMNRQQKDNRENPAFFGFKDPAVSSVFDSMTSYQLALAHLMGGELWKHMSQEDREAKIAGLQYTFGLDQAEGGYTLYTRLVMALSEAAGKRRGGSPTKYDIFIRPQGQTENYNICWYDAVGSQAYPENLSCEIFANYLANWILTRSISSTNEPMTEAVLGTILANPEKAKDLFQRIGYVSESKKAAETDGSANPIANEANANLSAGQVQQEKDQKEDAEAELASDTADVTGKDADAVTPVDDDEGEGVDDTPAPVVDPNTQQLVPAKEPDAEPIASKEPTPEPEAAAAPVVDQSAPVATENAAPAPAPAPEAVPSEVDSGPSITHIPPKVPGKPDIVKPKAKPFAAPGAAVPSGASPAAVKPVIVKPKAKAPKPTGQLFPAKDAPKAAPTIVKGKPSPVVKKQDSFRFEKVSETKESLVHLLRIASLYNRKGQYDKANAINEYVKKVIAHSDTAVHKQAIADSMHDLLRVSSTLQKEGKIDEAQEINRLVKKYLPIIQHVD